MFILNSKNPHRHYKIHSTKACTTKFHILCESISSSAPFYFINKKSRTVRKNTNNILICKHSIKYFLLQTLNY